MISKSEKISLDELLVSDGWKTLTKYLNEVSKQIVIYNNSTLGNNDIKYSERDRKIIELSVIQTIINKPQSLLASYQEGGSMGFDDIDGMIKNIDFDELSRSLS